MTHIPTHHAHEKLHVRKPTARAAEAVAMNDYECVEPMPRQQRRKVSILHSHTVFQM